MKVVKPGQIEESLLELWRQQGSVNAIRGYLFNLIIFTNDAKKLDYLKSLTQAFTQKFPCRMMFVVTGEKSIQVSVSSDVIESDKGKISTDRILIKTSEKEKECVPFLLTPHLIPDLPVYLFWGHNPDPTDEIFQSLKRFATRLIFDSECTDNLQAYSRSMLRVLEESKTNCVDINWALISGWRHMLYRLFDNPKYLDQLTHTGSMKICYNSCKTDFIERVETQAIYLQAWIAARLGWKVCTSAGFRVCYEGVDVEIQGEMQKGLPPGKILGITFEQDRESIEIIHSENSPKATVEITYADQCEMPISYPLGDYQRTFSFAKEIFYNSISDHYESMLQTLSEVEWTR